MKKKFNNKRERFLVLAEERTNKVIEALFILSHCANKNLYKYEEQEVQKIFKAILDEVFETEKRFKNKEVERFTLTKT